MAESNRIRWRKKETFKSQEGKKYVSLGLFLPLPACKSFLFTSYYGLSYNTCCLHTWRKINLIWFEIALLCVLYYLVWWCQQSLLYIIYLSPVLRAFYLFFPAFLSFWGFLCLFILPAYSVLLCSFPLFFIVLLCYWISCHYVFFWA